MIRFAAVCIAAVITTSSALAAGFSGPVSGYVLDKQSGVIRPINGFPGASLIGEGIELQAPLQSAVIRQSQDLAVGILKEGGFIARVTGLTTTPKVVIHNQWMANGDIVALNATGSTGAAYSKAEAKLIRFRGDSLEASIETSAYGDLTRVAVADHVTLFATKSQLYRWTEGPAEAIGSFDEISGIAFLDDNSAAVADGLADSVFLVSDVRGSREMRLIAAGKDGVNEPAAVCPGPNGRLLVANSDATALVVELSTGNIAPVLFLASKPARCETLKSDSLLVLNDLGESPLVLVDLSEMASYFVPVNTK